LGLLDLARASAVVLSRLTPSLYDFSLQFRQAQLAGGGGAAAANGTSSTGSTGSSTGGGGGAGAAAAAAQPPDVLAPQCPARFATGEAILCQWHNPACSAKVGQVAAAARLRVLSPQHRNSNPLLALRTRSRLSALFQMLTMADRAGRFQQEAGLVARQLLGAEQCVSSVCLEHTGTANAVARRKHNRQGKKRRAGDLR